MRVSGEAPAGSSRRHVDECPGRASGHLYDVGHPTGRPAVSDLILLAHIIGAAMWFGAHVYLEGLFASALKADDPAVTGSVFDRVSVTNGRLMPVAAGITIVCGIWLVLDRPAWEFEQLFITISFALAIAGAAIGIFVLSPREKAYRGVVAEHGVGSHEAHTAAKSLANIGHLQSAIVAVALVVMVLKPGI